MLSQNQPPNPCYKTSSYENFILFTQFIYFCQILQYILFCGKKLIITSKQLNNINFKDFINIFNKNRWLLIPKKINREPNPEQETNRKHLLLFK